jgi:hypothetical protein
MLVCQLILHSALLLILITTRDDWLSLRHLYSMYIPVFAGSPTKKHEHAPLLLPLLATSPWPVQVHSMHLRYCPSRQHPLFNGSPASTSTEYAPALLPLLTKSPFLMEALPAQVHSMHLRYHSPGNIPPFYGSPASTSTDNIPLFNGTPASKELIPLTEVEHTTIR